MTQSSKIRTRIHFVTIIILIVGCMIGFYASCIEPFKLVVTQWTVKTAKWDNPKPLKIAILTDIHMIWPWMSADHLQTIVDKTNDQHPDIILLLGDYVGTHPFGVQIRPRDGLLPLKNLKAECGVYAVAGNHDIYPPSSWMNAVEEMNVTVLANRTRPVTCHDQKFWVAGLEELWRQNANPEAALLRVNDKHPVIMMMHNPDSFPDVPASVALSVAGHTHGGQFKLPLIGAITSVIPSQYGKRYLYGHIVEDGKDLIVSSGLGMTGLPIRFLTPPEISIVTLQGIAD